MRVLLVIRLKTTQRKIIRLRPQRLFNTAHIQLLVHVGTHADKTPRSLTAV